MRLLKFSSLVLFVAGLSSVAYAGGGVPELDPSIIASACLLIGGAVLVIRSRRKK